MSMLVQNEQGEWFHIWMGARQDRSNLGYILFKSEAGMSIDKMSANSAEEAIVEAQQHHAKPESKFQAYRESVVIATTSLQDKQIYANALETQEKINSGKKKYNALTYNCGTSCVKIAEKDTGLDLKKARSPIPVKRFEQIKENMNATNASIIRWIENYFDEAEKAEEQEEGQTQQNQTEGEGG